MFRQLFDAQTHTYTYLLGDPDSGEAVLVDPVVGQEDRDLRLIEELGPVLLRAKGVVALAERKGALLFQMVGRRAGFEPATNAAPGCRLVMIGEGATFDPDKVRERLNALVVATPHIEPIEKGPER